MTEFDIIDALTELGGTDHKLHPTLDNCYTVAKKIGLHDKDKFALRVKWINNLRKIVDRRMPLNKMGSPMTTDVDLMTANSEEVAESILRTMNKWKE